MDLRQARLLLPKPFPPPNDLRCFWRLISGDPTALKEVNHTFYWWVQPFLTVGAYNARSAAFRGYRRKLGKRRVDLGSLRYNTRSADPLMDWLQSHPGNPRLFSEAYIYWSKFPKAYIATYLYPAEVTIVCDKVLSWHQATPEWTDANRRKLQELADQALGYLEHPVKLAEYRQVRLKEAA
jgi:hypothetical protein